MRKWTLLKILCSRGPLRLIGLLLNVKFSYVHTNAFSFGFVFGDAENAPRLSVDTTVFIPFSQRLYVCIFIWIYFRERFHIDAVLPKTPSVLVWTEGLNAWKCVQFQTKMD